VSAHAAPDRSPTVEAPAGSTRVDSWRRALPLLWGVVVAVGLARFFFRYGPGEMHVTHEGNSYLYRVVEFLSCLQAGYAFPEWAVDFRGGLGSPALGYYQPGFFYVASAFAAWLPVQSALGMTVIVFSVVGYAALLYLVGERFGTTAGVLAGTLLLLAPFSLVELYLRGDLSEYCAMMMLPAVLYCLIGWMERGRREHWLGLAATCGVLVVMHPAAALFGYAMFGIVALVYGIAVWLPARAAGAVAAMFAGGMLAAFFWVPVALQWDLVEGDRAATSLYTYSLHFIDPRTLVLPGAQRHAPVKVSRVALTAIGAATVLLLVRWRSVTAAQWRLVGVLWLSAILAAFMMGPASHPVWEALPFFHRVQFPWRLAVVVTVAVSALAGCTPAYARRLGDMAMAATVWTSLSVIPYGRQYPIVDTPAAIRATFVRSDAADEWLPRGARPFKADKVPREARCDPPDCRVERFEREPGRLRAEVTTVGPASLVLPHYWFPVGWRATRDGVPLALVRTGDGLMRVEVPAGGGVVDVTFSMTPKRRLGVAVSAVTLVLLLVLLAIPRADGSRHA
jgi:hypothetical protein